MKTYYKITLAFVLVMFSIISCTDVLDTKPGNTFSEKDIYSDIESAEKLVFHTYNITQHWGLNLNGNWWTRKINIEGASDEAWFHWAPQTFRITRGEITPTDMGLFGGKWNRFYMFIKEANDFLSKVEGTPIAESYPDRVAELKAEMKYLRASGYARLLEFYGGVPLIKKPFELSDDFKVQRSSYEECVDFIVQELNEAIDILPVNRPDAEFGRVTKGAAMALKSRVLLYAASKLHDPSTEPSGPLYDYDKASKWQDASDAAKELIDLNEYSLVQVDTPSEYQEMFLAPNSELIFARPFHPQYGNVPNDINSLPDKVHGPVSQNAWGASNPTHNFVQDFKMANGKHINESDSGYDPNNMYEGREMRFYANILYQGATMRGDSLEYWLPGGADSPDAPGPDHFAQTGYNLRKFMDEVNVQDVNNQISPRRPYPLARLPEIYLNYAEAQYHLGNEAEAREYVSKVAERVGLPEITSSGQELLEDIRYERQMELFFEGHRFFDLRRWMDTDNLGEDVMGVQWEKRNSSGELDPNGELIMIGPNLIEDRTFHTRNYYLPIDRSEIEKSGIQQNFGY